MPVSTICLFFSDTGGGHRSATEAIAAGIQSVAAGQDTGQQPSDQQIEVVCENIIEKSSWINRLFVETYNFLLRHNQAGMKYYYWFVHQFQLNNSKLGYQLVKPYIKKLLFDLKPNVIVSVHPMINQYLIRGLTDSGLIGKIPFVVVVTDPNDKLWNGWACPEANLTIVPNETAKNKLVSWGVPEEKVQVIGMPVHPNFLQPPDTDRQKFLSNLGLDPATFTLCLNAGWAGGGNMLAIYKALNQVKKKIQVIFLCGHNYTLYKTVIEKAASSNIPTHVLPFHDNMVDMMNAVDLMVTKAGGLTTFEALACHLPLAIDVITNPMPQEAGTIDILLEASKHTHLAHPVKQPADIIKIVESTELNSNRKNVPLPAFQNLDHVEAVYDISKIVLDHLHVSMKTENMSINRLK